MAKDAMTPTPDPKPSLTVEQVEELREWLLEIRRPSQHAAINALCDHALADITRSGTQEAVATVLVRTELRRGEHGRYISWLANPIDIPANTKLYLSQPAQGRLAEELLVMTMVAQQNGDDLDEVRDQLVAAESRERAMREELARTQARLNAKYIRARAQGMRER